MTDTALLIIDIQRGAFDGVRCPPIDSPGRLADHAGALLQAARAGGHMVVFVQHCDEPGQAFEENTAHWLLHESLVPEPGDVLLKKHESSSFNGTDLASQLKTKGIEKLVLCGLQSEFCVSNTTRSALELGYTVSVASDGHSTWPSEGRSAAEIETEVNARLAAAGAWLATTGHLAALLRQAP